MGREKEGKEPGAVGGWPLTLSGRALVGGLLLLLLLLRVEPRAHWAAAALFSAYDR